MILSANPAREQTGRSPAPEVVKSRRSQPFGGHSHFVGKDTQVCRGPGLGETHRGDPSSREPSVMLTAAFSRVCCRLPPWGQQWLNAGPGVREDPRAVRFPEFPTVLTLPGQGTHPSPAALLRDVPPPVLGAAALSTASGTGLRALPCRPRKHQKPLRSWINGADFPQRPWRSRVQLPTSAKDTFSLRLPCTVC